MNARWVDPGHWPIEIRFIPDKQAWNREMRKMGLADKYPDVDAQMNTFDHDGKAFAFITISERLDGQNPTAIVGLLAHEVVHIKQRLFDMVGEKAPGDECEAYFVQNVLMGVINAYSATRMKA